jgi:hypothetical protein
VISMLSVLVTYQWTSSLTRDTCFLWGPCRITEKAVQEGWVESIRTRMGHVLSELWSLVAFSLGQRSTDWLKIK